LEKKEKATNPTYQFFEKEDLPSYSENGVEVTDIVGPNSPIMLNTEITYQHLKFDRETQLSIKIKQQHNAILYIVRGNFEINNQFYDAGESLLISTKEDDILSILAKNSGLLMFCSCLPHREPIFQHGPYVD